MKYYRHTITIEVLSNDISNFEYEYLTDVHYHCTEGHCSGKFSTTKVEELTADEMAKALKEQGTDPTFLLDDDDDDDDDDDRPLKKATKKKATKKKRR